MVAVQDHERAGRRHEPLARACRRGRADLQHDLGTVPGEPGVIAEQQLSRRQRAARVRRVEAEAAQRLGENRPAEERAERQERQRLRRPQRADRDDAAATRVARDEGVERGADRVRVVFDLGYGGRVTARPGRPAVGNGRLLEAAVDVHRAGRRARRVGQRAHARVEPRRGVAVVAGHRRLQVGARVPPVQLGLVDRLVRTRAAQPGRPVGGQRHEPSPRLRRLDHGGQVSGRRGAAGTRDRDRRVRHRGDAEREERGAPLVEMDVHRDALVARERQCKRRGARSGRQARVVDPAAGERVDQGRGAGE